MEETKPFWASKTIWVNIIAVGAVLAGSAGLEITADLQASIVATVMGIANIILRFVTKAPISA